MPSYLQLHQGKYRPLRWVPPDLRKIIGKTWLTDKSTGTSDMELAKKLAEPSLVRFEREIVRARERLMKVNLRHSRAATRSCEYYTPVKIFDAMGVEFDMDVCSPGQQVTPWIPAKHFVVLPNEDGLVVDWDGFIWCNPPFGIRYGMRKWIERFIALGDGVLCVPANTYTGWWQDLSRRCDAMVLVDKHVNFISKRKKKTKTTFGTTLFACGEKGVAALKTAATNGLGCFVVLS